MNKQEIQKQIARQQRLKKKAIENYDETIKFLRGEKKKAPDAPPNLENALVRDVIDAFKALNPSHHLLFGRKNQRDAAQRIGNKYGLEKVQNAVRFILEVEKQQKMGNPKAKFLPSISSPEEFESKIKKLISFKESYAVEVNSHVKIN